MAKVIGLHTDMVKQKAQNVGAGQVTAFKADDALMFSSYVGGNVVGGIGTSYVTRQNVHRQTDQGVLDASSSKCHLGLQGNGYFLVADQGPDKENYNISMIRRGDWQQAVNGGMRIGENYLLGFALDDEGNPVARDTGRVDSLEHFNAEKFAQLKPKATTQIDLAVNLNANREVLQGSSLEAVASSLGRNASNSNLDLLLPDRLKGSGLELGATFTMMTEPKNQEKTIEYGGIVSAYTPSNAKKIYGAEAVADAFTFKPVAGPGELQTGHELKITVNGKTTYSFKAVSGAANPAEREFNSISSLAAAIEKVSGLKARIDGTIHIAPEEPNHSVTFTNGGGGSLREALGLTNDIKAMEVGEHRFNSIQSFLNAVNDNPRTDGLLASFDSKSGKIEIGARLATDTFVLRGKSVGTHNFTKAVINESASEKGRATITIHASENNLKEGDYVRVHGLGIASAPDGVYMIGRADKNGFDIYTLSDDPSAPSGNTITDGFSSSKVADPKSYNVPGSWEKVAAKKEGEKITIDPNTGLAHQGANTLRITNNNHGLANNDVIFISGLGKGIKGGNNHSVPDGYYIVTVNDVNSFDIKSANYVVDVNDPPSNYSNSFTFQKVCSNLSNNFGDAAYSTIPTTVFETLANDLTQSAHSMVKLHLTHHNYSPGDMLMFDDLPIGYTIDNLPLNNGQNYKIIAATDGDITFEVDGYTGATGGISGKYGDNAVVSEDVGFDFKINKHSRGLEYFGLGQGDSGATEQRLEARYDPANPERSLSGTGNFENKEIFSHVAELINGVGNKYYLRFNFAMLDTGDWAIEVGGVENAETGEFAIQQVTNDGKLGHGRINFDQNGNMQTVDVAITELSIKLENNETNNVRLNLTDGSLTQYAAPDVVKKYSHDGVTFGEMSDIDIAIDGTVTISYDNGVKKKVFQIPLAKVPDPNNLRMGINDTLQQSIDAGDMQIGFAGQSGFAKMICGTLEQSNVERTKELIDIRQLQTIIAGIARSQATQNKIEEDTLSELR